MFPELLDTERSFWKCTLWYEEIFDKRVMYDKITVHTLPTALLKKIWVTTEQIVVRNTDDLFMWDDILQDGEECFDYLQYSMHHMLRQRTILNLGMVGMYDVLSDKAEELYNEYRWDIHEITYQFIYYEHKTGDIVNRALWKVFRKASHPEIGELGYRKLIKFDKYYIQLGIKSFCLTPLHHTQQHLYFKENMIFYFTLRLYGIEENGSILPFNDSILPNNMLSDDAWNSNNVR